MTDPIDELARELCHRTHAKRLRRIGEPMPEHPVPFEQLPAEDQANWRLLAEVVLEQRQAASPPAPPAQPAARACNERPPHGHAMRPWGVACHMAAGHDGPHTWDTHPSPARRGLDRLLEVMAFREVESIDSQPAREATTTRDYFAAPLRETPAREAGAWVLVTLVGGDHYAIWKATGDVYSVGPDGAVADDPIIRSRA